MRIQSELSLPTTASDSCFWSGFDIALVVPIDLRARSSIAIAGTDPDHSPLAPAVRTAEKLNTFSSRRRITAMFLAFSSRAIRRPSVDDIEARKLKLVSPISSPTLAKNFPRMGTRSPEQVENLEDRKLM